jgi:LEA14-like dessication related protein
MWQRWNGGSGRSRSISSGRFSVCLLRKESEESGGRSRSQPGTEIPEHSCEVAHIDFMLDCDFILFYSILNGRKSKIKNRRKSKIKNRIKSKIENGRKSKIEYGRKSKIKENQKEKKIENGRKSKIKNGRK